MFAAAPKALIDILNSPWDSVRLAHIWGRKMRNFFAAFAIVIVAALLPRWELAAQTAPPSQVLQMVIQSHPNAGQKCIDTPFSQFVAGAKLQLWDCNNTNAQTFEYDLSAQRLGIGNLCVESPDNAGDAIGLAACTNGSNQRWSMTASGDYYQVLDGKMRCLEVKANAGGDGAPLDAQNCMQSNYSQLWALVQAPASPNLAGTQGVPSTVPLMLYWSAQRGDNFTTATPQGQADAQAAGDSFVRIEGRVFPNQVAGTVPLMLYWSAQRGDNFTTATPQGQADAQAAGDSFVRIEGRVFPNQVAGTVPLMLYWSAQRGDNFTTATPQGQADAQAAGYSFVRIEGSVFPQQVAGTVPLMLYWSAQRGDNFTTATPQGQADAQAAGYAFVRIEGYIYPP
jgi:uncharacterized Zn-binding protein involved in type VI secretion